MFAVSVEMTVHPGKIDEFVAAITIHSEKSRANEPGCLRFDIMQNGDDPTRFLLVEVYESEEAFSVSHRQTSHYAQWVEAAREYVMGDRLVVAYKPLRLELSRDD